jgi:hypothetical protein
MVVKGSTDALAKAEDCSDFTDDKYEAVKTADLQTTGYGSYQTICQSGSNAAHEDEPRNLLYPTGAF